MNNTFLLFYCPMPRSQVWIFIYGIWSINTVKIRSNTGCQRFFSRGEDDVSSQWRHQIVKSKLSKVSRILIYTRLKINKKKIFAQVSIPVARFISKKQQFELPNFHSAWQQNRNAVSLKKKSLLFLFSGITISSIRRYVYTPVC